ncbi:hypothetical protein B7494_g158 [Chlorociboria aeruginascens]|nr:hypothetical protein B7494_g158 [Chlorociboria aeruginascens]
MGHYTPLDWQLNMRADRPFVYTRRHPAPRPPVRPWLLPQRRIPTAFYLSQLELSQDPTGPDPYAHRGGTRQVPALQACVEGVISILKAFIAAVGNLPWALMWLLYWVIWIPLKTVCNVVAGIDWEVILTMVVAIQIVKLLPSIEKVAIDANAELEEAWKMEGPVYFLVPDVRRWGKL